MLGEATPVQVAGFVVALRAKGEAPDEVTGLVTRDARRTPRGSRSTARPSTPAAPAATGRTRSTSRRCRRWSSPAPGARVVKHGNRSASSACGSADLLEELGVVVDLAPAAGRPSACGSAGVDVLLRAACSTPRCGTPRSRGASSACPRSSTSSARWPTRPSRRPRRSACADARMAGVMAEVLADRGASALVFRGDDGLDELTVGDDRRRSGWCATAACRRRPLAPEDVGLAGADAVGAARRRRARTTPRSPGASSRARRGRCATPCCSTPPPRWSRWTRRRRAADVPLRRPSRWPTAARPRSARAGRVGRQRRGRAGALAGWVDDQPGARRAVGALDAGGPARCSVGVLDAEGERRVEVVLGVGAEGDVRLGAP